MQGIAVLTNPQGKPSVLTIDLTNHDQRLDGLIDQLLKEVVQDDTQNERTFWTALGTESFNGAYSENEFEYSEADLKTLNPNFELWKAK